MEPAMRTRRTPRPSPLLLIAPLLAAACGQSTTGKTVTLHTRLATELPADQTVTTDLGWTVTVKTLLVASGPFYYFDGEPAFTMASRRSRWRRAVDALSPFGTAWAHPGHYVAGNARGEMLAPYTADLLAGPSELPDGDGITGPVRSGTFSFAPPSDGPAATALGGHVAVAEGAATKDGQTINFVFTADVADVSKNARDAEITGCPFSAADVDGDGTVTVTVKPKVWFAFVDFSELLPGTPQAPTVADPSTTAYIAFSLGLVQLSAYQFAFSPQEQAP
jgi:hypothetical protein